MCAYNICVCAYTYLGIFWLVCSCSESRLGQAADSIVLPNQTLVQLLLTPVGTVETSPTNNLTQG